LAPRKSAPAERTKLAGVVRYRPSAVVRSSRYGVITTTPTASISTTISGTTAVSLTPGQASADRPLTVVLHDDGRRAAASLVVERLARDESVLAVDVLFFADLVPEQPVSPGVDLGVDPTIRSRRPRRTIRCWSPRSANGRSASGWRSCSACCDGLKD
jgi:hypothetical protein